MSTELKEVFPASRVVIADYINDELGTDTLPEFVPADTVGSVEATKPVAEQNKSIVDSNANQLRVTVEGTTYVARDNKLYVEYIKGDKTYTFFVSSLIVVVAKARDIKGKGWGKVIRFVDGDGVVKQIYIRNSEILTNDKGIINQLAEDGLQVSTESKMIAALIHYLNMAPPLEKEMAICTDKLGWHGDIYIFSDNSFVGTSKTRAVYTGEIAGTAHSVKGTVQEWRDFVAAICKGNSLLIFAVCIAFAAVLLRLLKVESGGYHYFGTSSTGKSTTLFVGASVHGDPEKLISSWNATEVGIEVTAKKHNDSLMILDELHESNEKVANKVGYSLFNPKGRTRGTKTGGVNEAAERRLNCLSSGEVSYADFVRESGKVARPGQTVRLSDIPADMEKGFGVFEDIHDSETPKAFSERIKHVTTEYYGAPIRTFLEKLIGYKPDTVITRYQAISDKFFTDYVPAQADSQVTRVASKYAVAALAGELATDMGITGWDMHDAFKAVGVVYTKWLANRGTIGQQEPERAVDQARNFLLRHGMSRFMPVVKRPNGHFDMEFSDRQYNNLAGYRYSNNDDKHEFIVLPGPFRDEICSGLISHNVVTTLVDRGYLMVEPDGTPQVRRRLPGMEQARVYHFNPSIFGIADEFDAEVESEDQQ